MYITIKLENDIGTVIDRKTHIDTEINDAIKEFVDDNTFLSGDKIIIEIDEQD